MTLRDYALLGGIGLMLACRTGDGFSRETRPFLRSADQGALELASPRRHSVPPPDFDLGTANSAARAELTACADLAGDAGLAVPEGEVQSEDQGRAVSPSPTASMMANDKVTDDEQVPSLW